MARTRIREHRHTLHTHVAVAIRNFIGSKTCSSVDPRARACICSVCTQIWDDWDRKCEPKARDSGKAASRLSPRTRTRFERIHCVRACDGDLLDVEEGKVICAARGSRFVYAF